MYCATQVVGDFFEERVCELFDLVRADRKQLGNVPDLISRDGSFYVEVKASSYRNGGVINKGQLFRFHEEINIRRFYAFAYHSIKSHMQRDYGTEEELRKALDLKSLFLFPFSITKAYFDKSKKRVTRRHDDFVQLRECFALGLALLERDAWEHIGLKPEDYKIVRPHPKIHLVTKGGQLEEQILGSFHPEFL